MPKDKYVVKTEIKELMKKHGVSVRDLANEFNDVAPGTWGNRLNGFITYDDWGKVEKFIKGSKKD